MKVRGVLIENSFGKNLSGQVTAEVEIEPLKVQWDFHGLQYIPGEMAIRRNRSGFTPLQQQEARVLSSLVMRGGSATYDEIYLDAWGYIPQISRRLAVHVSTLRRKLQPIGMDILGRGNQSYMLIVRDER